MLYAIGDFHLSFGVHKPMDIFGGEWENHVQKIEENCRRIVGPEDTLVITGDHSWGRNLEECRADLEFIVSLPGRKILLRGNHDMFWDAKKTQKLNDLYEGQLLFLQNNFYTYGDYALVGTKGYCYDEKDSREHFVKIRNREVERLRVSFEMAKASGFEKYIVFLHYPPTSISEQESPFTMLAKEYGAEKVVYSHCHGEERYSDSLLGMVDGMEYQLVSSDYLHFCPAPIL